MKLSGRVQIAEAVAAVPAIPAAGAGPSIADIRLGGHTPKYQLVQIRKNAGAGDVTLTGPVKVYGELNSGVDLVGELNDGEDIVVGAAGWSALVQGLALYERLMIRPAAITADHSYNAFLVGVAGSP